ncbi:Histone acetyltransferase rtt109 [Paramyrothecium foliicola]|nr:Histone acetyltransferase rtt109 [Paramyrothecium foliicola]
MDSKISNGSSPVDHGLRDRLARVLPKDHVFGIYHLSTPPRKVDALCSAPPNERPDRTYCENHFLAVSIDCPPTSAGGTEDAKGAARPVLVLGVEVFIYTTAHSTTLFVSKADSTGHLNLLNLPRGTPSPIREVCAAFIAHLVAERRRKDVQFVVSLFARAQAQYLFPGSVDCPGKHVLDDRGLVKWWCRVLNPLLEQPPTGTGPIWKSTKGYLLVPGLDDYEMRAFIPRGSASLWSLGHALERISHYHGEFDWLPPRCLIPRFPDDPKSRFRDELDEEAAKTGAMRTTGIWKSVKTLDTFWEMMAYRQECSSGRLTGFIWVVFDDKEDKKEERPAPGASQDKPTTSAAPETPKKQRTTSIVTPTTTPRKLFPSKSVMSNGSPTKSSATPQGKKKSKSKKSKLKGPIIPRQPKVKKSLRNYLLERPASTPYYHWPPAGRGERIVDETEYKRIVELLLHLDFASLDKATRSTRRWVGEVGKGSSTGKWGYDVVGTRDIPSAAAANGAEGQPANNLSGLVKRKRGDTTSAEEAGPKVNVLSTGLVKRKPKEQTPQDADEPVPEVNVLGAGLVRKKPKA